MSTLSSLRLCLFSLSLHIVTSSASPITRLVARADLHKLSPRAMTKGATAGLGIGIAVAAILVILLGAFVFIHYRRTMRNAAFERERAQVARGASKASKKNAKAASNAAPAAFTSDISNAEKNGQADDKQEPQVSTIPRRQKSIKDRLMGPLYRDSTADPLPLPDRSYARKSKMGAANSDDDLVGPPSIDKRSTVYSFSSRRATRMMMMM